MSKLANLRGKLGKHQSAALEAILNSPTPIRAGALNAAFPKNPQFTDRLQPNQARTLDSVLSSLNRELQSSARKIARLTVILAAIDRAITRKNAKDAIALFHECIDSFGWSHVLLRKIILLRESFEAENDEVESLVERAGLHSNAVVITSLIHVFSPDQNFITIKRSIKNIIDRGALNKFSRALARIPVQPFATDAIELTLLLIEARSCSLIDAAVLANFNNHLFPTVGFPQLYQMSMTLGKQVPSEDILAMYDANDEDSEYLFYKQSAAWLEYDFVKRYRSFVDQYMDMSSDDLAASATPPYQSTLEYNKMPALSVLLGQTSADAHPLREISALEAQGVVTRSALFNYWIYETNGQLGFERQDLLSVMGKTRDLARTIPIVATRNAIVIASDKLVRFILLLLLARRSKNELDSFHLRKMIEEIALKEYGGSLVRLLEEYEASHRYISEYIYEIATEDFLAKLNRLAPHLSDISETRARLHEWMAKVTGDERYNERARAVRVDHQLNRIRNEIDDNRIYVDPSRFSSWIQDEMMIEINNALTITGPSKKNSALSSDEAVLSYVVRQCYSTFCSNPIFGIASYIGRRIRHGTFHGHLYSSLVNQVESSQGFLRVASNPSFSASWSAWKDQFGAHVAEIIRDRLHVQSRSKPNGLLQPDLYPPHKQEVLEAAVKVLIATYGELKSTTGCELVITDYCWRLAESDLAAITAYIQTQKARLKQTEILNEMVEAVPAYLRAAATEVRRDVVRLIDSKLLAICGWFKRPSSVAPKASLALLFDAVVHEVKDTIPEFNPQTEASPHGDIELVGGAYHIMYDSLAVVVSNAAKYGDPLRPVRRSFSVVTDYGEKKEKRLMVEVVSFVSPTANLSEVRAAIEQRKWADYTDANLYERRSGIPKIMQMSHTRQDFSVEELSVSDDQVRVRFSYVLGY